MPNEWYNRTQGGVDAGQMDGYFEVGASNMLAPQFQQQSGFLADYLTVGASGMTKPQFTQPSSFLSGIGVQPYSSPTFDGGLLGDLGQLESIGQLTEAIGGLMKGGVELWQGVEMGKINLEQAELQLDLLKQKAAEAKTKVAATPDPEATQAYTDLVKLTQQLAQKIEQKKPFYQKPEIMVPVVAAGALAAWWFFLR